MSPKAIPATLYHVHWIDSPVGPPYAEFRFLYRSRDVLASKGITVQVPDTNMKSPSPPSKKRKARNLKPKKKPTKDGTSVSPKTPTKPQAKKAKTGPKNQIKTEFAEYSPIRRESPTTVSDPTRPTTSPGFQHRLNSLPNVGMLHWVESQTPTELDDTDILNELRELQVCPSLSPLTGRKKLNVSSMQRHNHISLLRQCRRIILGWDRICMLHWGYNRVLRIWGLQGH
jgi:hypothetical protein